MMDLLDLGMKPGTWFERVGVAVELSGGEECAREAHARHRSSHQGGVSDIDAWQ
jgi:hypothetical protein